MTPEDVIRKAMAVSGIYTAHEDAAGEITNALRESGYLCDQLDYEVMVSQISKTIQMTCIGHAKLSSIEIDGLSRLITSDIHCNLLPRPKPPQ